MKKAEQIRDYYDKFADVYDTKHGVVLAGQAYNFNRHYQPFLNAWTPRSGKALELGCGTGVYTAWLCARGMEVTGIDISADMIKQARKKCPEASYCQGDCEDPAAALGDNFIEGGYDAIIGINTFSYYAHKADALSKYLDILKPGGLFIVLDMNGQCPYYPLMSFLNINEMKQWLQEIRQSNRGFLTRLLLDAGYEIEVMKRFALVPNGLNCVSVALMKPIDWLLGPLPFFKAWAMRIAFVASKPSVP